MPPGWRLNCVCLYPAPGHKPARERPLALTPPDGYNISSTCEGCSFPTYNQARKTWCCAVEDVTANPNCYLVEVPREGPDNKKITILGKPNEEVHESHLHNDYDVFCVCLTKLS